MMLYFVGAGYRIPITNMFDIDGQPTDDHEAATAIVGPLPNGKWLAIECHQGEIIEQEPN